MHLENVERERHGKEHTLASVLPAMEEACKELGDEFEEVERETERIVKEMEDIVGELSNLRYGSFVPVADGEGGPEGECFGGFGWVEEEL